MIPDIGLTVRVIAGIRTDTATRTGCPEWDGPGIRKALIATDGPPAAVIAAACIAAGDPTLDKPSAAAFTARWHSKAETPAPPPPPVVCPTHAIQHSVMDRCPSCAGDEKAHAEEFEPVTGPARTRTAPPDFTDLRRRLEDVKHQQRAQVEAIRAGGAS